MQTDTLSSFYISPNWLQYSNENNKEIKFLAACCSSAKTGAN